MKRIAVAVLVALLLGAWTWWSHPVTGHHHDYAMYVQPWTSGDCEGAKFVFVCKSYDGFRCSLRTYFRNFGVCYPPGGGA